MSGMNNNNSSSSSNGGAGGRSNGGRNGLPGDEQYTHSLHQHPLHMDTQSAYGMNHPAMGHHQHSLSQPNPLFTQMNAPQQQQMMTSRYMSSHGHSASTSQIVANDHRPRTEPAPKSFACSTCGKGFARRSDLARHERIHSGIRPHACEHPGCGKEFIQRSALTVHNRVHTGEKPHMCERCGKPFSDSSSLARHRRIHSGKRPYKCPYANCQKTFTRRTTLTRHQNHHTGTVEQAQAETNAKLSITQSQIQPQPSIGSYSEDHSRNSTVSPTEPVPVSPNHTMNAMQVMAQQNNDLHFLPQQQHAMSSHMRTEYHGHPGRISQAVGVAPVSAFSGMPSARMTMAPHPGGNFVPPTTLERPATGSGSGNVSPHMPTMGWPSPHNTGMTNQSSMDAFYQDQAHFGHQAGHTYGTTGMFYPSNNMRRPQSTEPDDYGFRPRPQMSHHLATGAIPMSDPNWPQMRNYAVGH